MTEMPYRLCNIESAEPMTELTYRVCSVEQALAMTKIPYRLCNVEEAQAMDKMSTSPQHRVRELTSYISIHSGSLILAIALRSIHNSNILRERGFLTSVQKVLQMDTPIRICPT